LRRLSARYGETATYNYRRVDVLASRNNSCNLLKRSSISDISSLVVTADGLDSFLVGTVHIRISKFKFIHEKQRNQKPLIHNSNNSVPADGRLAVGD